jgi:hypothetical protein
VKYKDELAKLQGEAEGVAESCALSCNRFAMIFFPEGDTSNYDF